MWKVEDCDLEIHSHGFCSVDALRKAVADNCDVCYIGKIASHRWGDVFKNRVTDSGVFDRLVKPREYTNLYW